MSIDIENLTLGQIKQLQSVIGCAQPKSSKDPAEGLPFKVGDAVLFRTVTMIVLGRVRTIGPDFFVLDEAGWVADTARYSEMLAKGTMNEFEPYPSWTIVWRGAGIDSQPWSHTLPRNAK